MSNVGIDIDIYIDIDNCYNLATWYVEDAHPYGASDDAISLVIQVHCSGWSLELAWHKC
jgi:hypothetical protein